MGFSDLLSSSRGPGIIGTLVALVVLGGFGLLFFFVFDEGMQGKEISIESVIRKNDEDIGSARRQLASRQLDLDQMPKRTADDQEANQLIASNALAVKQVAELQLDRDEALKAAETAKAALNDYKDTYRTAERKSAAGEKMAELKLLSGVVYTDVIISVVDKVGMQIRHSGGGKRIPYQDLPLPLQDRFQFDLDQMKDAIGSEAKVNEQHTGAVKLSEMQTKLASQQSQLQALKNQIESDNKTIQEIRQSSSSQREAINRFKGKIREEERKPVSRAQQMKIELQKMESNYNAVLASIGPREQSIKESESKIPGVMRDIESTQKEIREEQARYSAGSQ